MPILVYYRKQDGKVVETSPWREGTPFLSGEERLGPEYSAVLRDEIPGLVSGKQHVLRAGIVVLEDDPIQLERKNKRKLVLDKVKKKFELTDDEMRVLFG